MSRHGAGDDAHNLAYDGQYGYLAMQENISELVAKLREIGGPVSSLLANRFDDVLSSLPGWPGVDVAEWDAIRREAQEAA